MKEEEPDQNPESGVKSEPTHHARRPMNAFLIFCKRHRSVVRDKHPNLENRAITKILGEWWANLEEDDKACYTNLAKKYKDAFFNANPDFKWYKLPAPPLRTVSTIRPAQNEMTNDMPPQVDSKPDPEPLKNNNNSTKYDYNVKSYTDEPLPMFTPGKLADEAHMGGLSSLISSNSPTPDKNIYISTYAYSGHTPKTTHVYSKDNDTPQIIERLDTPERPKILSKEESIRELQNALSETSRIFAEDFQTDEKSDLVHLNNDTSNPYNNHLTNQQIINQIVDKRLHQEYNDHESCFRTVRSCKGKRYQEFMAIGGLIVNRRQKKEEFAMDDNLNPSCKWEYRSEESYMDEGNSPLDSPVKPEINVPSCHETISSQSEERRVSKPFKPADFDLDAKIKALPFLSLERYQQKKRESKKKKKNTFNIKPKESRPKYSECSYMGPNIASYGANTPKSFSQSQNIPKRLELSENWRETVIGSQKRKPRKISITRFDINSLVNRTDEYRHQTKNSPEIKLATEAPTTVVQNMEICKHSQHVTADLFALTTLAEVAANTSKIDETTISEVASRRDTPMV